MRTELKAFRIRQHLKQEEMAEMTGVSRATYGFIENGARGGSADFWSTLQEVFGVPDADMWKLQKLDRKSVRECEETDAR